MSTRQGLSIRAVNIGDADGLSDLLRASGIPASRERLVARLELLQAQAGAVLIAEEWGPPTGVIALNWSSRLTADAKVAQITLLLVDPERRRSGVARLLVKAASQAARAAGCGEIVLDAPVGIDSLSAFCLSTGFSVDGGAYSRSLRKRG